MGEVMGVGLSIERRWKWSVLGINSKSVVHTPLYFLVSLVNVETVHECEMHNPNTAVELLHIVKVISLVSIYVHSWLQCTM